MASQVIRDLKSGKFNFGEKVGLVEQCIIETQCVPSVQVQLIDGLIQQLAFKKGAASSSDVLEPSFWRLIDQSKESTVYHSSAAQLLLVFNQFLSQKPEDERLLQLFSSVIQKGLLSCMNKASPDMLDSAYSQCLDTVLDTPACGQWDAIFATYIESYSTIVARSFKGNKRIIQRHLTTLPKLCSIMSSLDTDSRSLRAISLLLKSTLFNVDNLKKGFARDTYNNNAIEDSQLLLDSTQQELFQALVPSPEAYISLPILLAAYTEALVLHSYTLFPLPSKLKVSNALATLSATETFSMAKKRALSIAWLKHTVNFLSSPLDDEKCVCLTATVRHLHDSGLLRESGLEENSNAKHDVLKSIMNQLEGRFQVKDLTFTNHYLDLCAEVFKLLSSDVVSEKQSLTKALFSKVVIYLSSADPVYDTREGSSAAHILRVIFDLYGQTQNLPRLFRCLSNIWANLSSLAEKSVLLWPELYYESGLETHILATSRIKTHFFECYQAVAVSQLASYLNDEGPVAKRSKGNEADISAPHSHISTVLLKIHFIALILKTMNKGTANIDIINSIKTNVLNDEVFEALEVAGVGTLGSQSLSNKKKRKATEVSAPSPWKEFFQYQLLQLQFELGHVVRQKEQISENNIWLQPKQIDLVERILNSARMGPITLECVNILLEAGATQAFSHVFAHLRKGAPRDKDERIWSGRVIDLIDEDYNNALWELISSRYLSLVNAEATDPQLEALSAWIVDSITTENNTGAFSRFSITKRMLNQVEFFEYKRIKNVLEQELTTALAFEGLSSVKKAAKATKIEIQDGHLELFKILEQYMPLEYLSNTTRHFLCDRAVCLYVYLRENGRDTGKLPRFLIHFRGSYNPKELDRFVQWLSEKDRVLEEDISLFLQGTSSPHLLELFKKPLSKTLKNIRKGNGAFESRDILFIDTLATVLGVKHLKKDTIISQVELALGNVIKILAEEPEGGVHLLTAVYTLWKAADVCGLDFKEGRVYARKMLIEATVVTDVKIYEAIALLVTYAVKRSMTEETLESYLAFQIIGRRQGHDQRLLNELMQSVCVSNSMTRELYEHALAQLSLVSSQPTIETLELASVFLAHPVPHERQFSQKVVQTIMESSQGQDTALVDFLHTISTKKPTLMNKPNLKLAWERLGLVLASDINTIDDSMFEKICQSVESIIRHRKEILSDVFVLVIRIVDALCRALSVKEHCARRVSRVLLSLNQDHSLKGVLSKHGPFMVRVYVQHAAGHLPHAVRSELQLGWNEIIDCMGVHERESITRMLARDDPQLDAQRALLKEMFKGWELERYMGE